MKQNIFFITYGTSEFKVAKKHLVMMAKKIDLFDSIFSFSPKDLNDDFKTKYAKTLSQKKGGGYWIWKHEIIRQTLEQAKNNDLVVYCDAGSSLNYYAKERMLDYINYLNSSKFSHFRFESEKDHIEKNWTTKELFDYFKIPLNSKIANTVQLEAGHMIFKKSSITEEYLQEYKKLLDFDVKLISDYYNNKSQNNYFIENRHDQSIFSLLSKTYGCVLLKNETQFKLNPENQYNYPFLSVRTYGHKKKDKLKMLFMPKKYYSDPVYFK